MDDKKQSGKSIWFKLMIGGEVLVLLALLVACGYREFSRSDQADNPAPIQARANEPQPPSNPTTDDSAMGTARVTHDAGAPSETPATPPPDTIPIRVKPRPERPSQPVWQLDNPLPAETKPADSRPAASRPASRGKAQPTTSARPVEYDSHPLPALKKPSIVIEKSRLCLTVYDDGRVVKRYAAAVGKNAGDKVREGDKRTPEGEFYVCVRNTASKYVLSLGLSYPSSSHALRGLREGRISRREYNKIVYALRRGLQPPWNTPLGGEIMIHGKRLGGRDTLGCIALEDDDIRELFPKIPVGTKVTIKP